MSRRLEDIINVAYYDIRQNMVSTSDAKTFDRSLTSQEDQMKADSAKQISTTEADVLSPSANRTDDKETDAAIETDPLGSAGPDCKNIPSFSAPVNGKTNKDPAIGKDGTKSLDESLRSSNDDDQSKEHVELPRLEDSQVQSVLGDSSEESDVMEQDVKVCDICGDAGREDLLAICNRCSDGAEHTYCMREMLQKVPDGEWFCEECKSTEQIENPKPGLQIEEKRPSKGSLSTQVLGKRTGEYIGIDSSKKKQALDRTIESPRASNGVAASSRDSLLKNVTKPKSGISSNDISHSSRSSNISRFQVSKSTLLKSKSFSAFSMKPKVKQVAEGRCQKQRGHLSSDARSLGKSASFKYPNREVPNALDSKAKFVSSKFSHAPEVKEPTSSNEQNTKNRLPRLDLDRPSSARNNTTHRVPKLERRDSSVADSDGKSGTSSQAVNSVARRSAETAFGSGPLLKDGVCIASPRKKSNLISPRNGAGLSMPAGTRKTQVGLPRSQDSPSNSEVDVPLTRRGEINCSNKAGTAVTTSMLKRPGIYGKNKPQDKSENSSIPGGGSSREHSTLSDASKKPANGTNSGKHMSSQNETQLNGLLNGFPKARKVEDLESAGQNQGKHVLKELSSELLSCVWKTSIIPEHACIWNGAFKLHRSGEMLDLHGGFQAHLTTNASPKVVEMATKFPEQIALTEVPRMSTWPVQFKDFGAKEANIALYFFARDMESYQMSYKGLLENLIKDDLALKANLDDIELLVYPSSQLPEKSQRWNMSFYLWGLFRRRRGTGVDSATSDDEESSKKKRKIYTEGKTECNDIRGSQLHDLNAKANEPSSKELPNVDNEVCPSAERCLFPVASPESTSSERNFFTRGPDLELALGAETNKTFPLPWMGGIIEKKDKEVEGSASLSLSLSFPFPDNAEMVKSLPKEKLVQEGTL